MSGYNYANPLTIGRSSALIGPCRSSEGVIRLLKDRRFQALERGVALQILN
jgi:hypothetical protein